ncbi:ABC transporter permease YtrF precursor [Polystyrenella longa]|uniref:ABC transporter permease YtrF n=1 Tax=Polystyrenella longa TaxID=2528007 RepID=A0A518CQJ8_9PLAN|nr:ABC transporter permease [Polystyrenella longa]QDU81507.1 ABC transporter permease YtrF precursor [Polystyrenella longa]
MSLIQIAWKSIRQRSLASSLTAFNMALGVMLMVTVLVFYGVIERSFRQSGAHYQLVVGPKGSKVDLVLSSVYRVSPPIENLPYLYYKQLKEDPRVEEAIPVALGDVTEEGSFPIVGTVSRYFELPYASGKKFRVKARNGFSGSFDAIVGAEVARTNGWDVGAKFKLVHGGADTGHTHDEEFEVVDILGRTGTPNDRTVFVNLKGFYLVSGHEKPVEESIAQLEKFYPAGIPGGEKRIKELREHAASEAAHHDHDHGDDDGHDHGHDHGHSHNHGLPDELKEVTSVFLMMKDQDDYMAYSFMNELKTGFQAQAVNPVQVMTDLMESLIGNVQKMMLVLIGLIIIVSGIGIFVSIYNSMADRRKEIAIMRSLGAQRQTIFAIILTESILLCLGGGILGLLLGHGLFYFGAPIIENNTGLVIERFAFEPLELTLFPVLLVLAALIGFLPGITAYRTNVADVLSE